MIKTQKEIDIEKQIKNLKKELSEEHKKLSGYIGKCFKKDNCLGTYYIFVQSGEFDDNENKAYFEVSVVKVPKGYETERFLYSKEVWEDDLRFDFVKITEEDEIPYSEYYEAFKDNVLMYAFKRED